MSRERNKRVHSRDAVEVEEPIFKKIRRTEDELEIHDRSNEPGPSSSLSAAAPKELSTSAELNRVSINLDSSTKLDISKIRDASTRKDAAKSILDRARNLPGELLEKIFSLLPLADICVVGGVCKSWRRAAFRSDAWKSVDVCRHWRQDPDPKHSENSRHFLFDLKKLRLLNFSSKYHDKSKTSTTNPGIRFYERLNSPTSSTSMFRFPRGPNLDVILKDLRGFIDQNPVLKSIDLTGADIDKPMTMMAVNRRDDEGENLHSSKDGLADSEGVLRVSTPRLPLDRLTNSAFEGLRQLESLAVETRVFAGFPYVPSIASQPWSRFLKRLTLTLTPREQGAPSRLRLNGSIWAEIAKRSNYLAVGSLQPLVDSCPSLEALSIDWSFGRMPASVGPHLVDPLRQLGKRLKELRLGLVCLPQVLQFWVGTREAEKAVRVLNDYLDRLFEPEKVVSSRVEDDKTLVASPFSSLRLFHLVNLEGFSLDNLTLRLATLSKVLFTAGTAKEMSVTGFRFVLPSSNPQHAENPFIHMPQDLESLRFLNQMERYNDQPLLHVGLVTALSELKHLHRLEADLPPLCWYGLQPIVKNLKSVELYGLSWSLATSFLLVIDNVESLSVHAELYPNVAEILQIAAFSLVRLRHLAFFDPSRPDTPFTLYPKVVASIFSHENWNRLISLRMEIHDFTPAALLNITTNCTSLARFDCLAMHANNFFGHSLEAEAETKAIEAFESLGRLGGTLEECRIDVCSRFLFDEADWPAESLARVFQRPADVFKKLDTLCFTYRCQEGNFCFSIARNWRGELCRSIDFWNEAGEISHYLKTKVGKGGITRRASLKDDLDGGGRTSGCVNDGEVGEKFENTDDDDDQKDVEAAQHVEDGRVVGRSGIFAEDVTEGAEGDRVVTNTGCVAVSDGRVVAADDVRRERETEERGSDEERNRKDVTEGYARGSDKVKTKQKHCDGEGDRVFEKSNSSAGPSGANIFGSGTGLWTTNSLGCGSGSGRTIHSSGSAESSSVDIFSSEAGPSSGTPGCGSSTAGWRWRGESIAAFKEKTRSIVDEPLSTTDDEGDWDETTEADLQQEWAEQGVDVAAEWDNDAAMGEEVDQVEEEESEDDYDAVEEVESLDDDDGVDEVDHAH